MSEDRIISELTFRRSRLTNDSGVSADPVFDNHKKCSAVKANVMCSDMDEFPRHYLILDLDMPVETYESSSGNTHLIVKHSLEFESMMEILTVLAKHGVVQQTWVDSAQKNGYATLRAPGIDKKNPIHNRGLDENGQVESAEEFQQAVSNAMDRATDTAMELNATFATGGPVASSPNTFRNTSHSPLPW